MGRFLNGKEHVLANEKEWITSEYGYRTDPITKKPGSYHPGMDFVDGRSWAPVDIEVAFGPGTVTTVVDDISWSYAETRSLAGISSKLYHGNHVVVTHAGGFQTTYKHIKLGSIVVKVGDKVAKGAKLGIVGTTGYSTGNHLHFELALNGTRIDPEPYFKGTKKLPGTVAPAPPPVVVYPKNPSDAEVRKAIDKFAAMGIVKTPAYWYLAYKKLLNVDFLFTELAKTITKKGTPCATVEIAIAMLHKAGLMNSPEYWLKNYGELLYLDLLLKELGGSV